MKIFKLSFLILFTLAGCATTQSVLKKIDKSKNVIEETFNAPYEEVFTATKYACAEAGLAIEEASKEKKYIVASSPMHTFQAFWTGTGYGALVGIRFEELGENKTVIKISAQGKYLLDFGARDPRTRLIVCIEKELLKKGYKKEER